MQSKNIELSVLEPHDTRSLVPDCPIDVWVYRYRHPTRGWTLSIGTHGEPQSGKMSLGGFRIAPANRADMPGYDNDREAIGLAAGMEEKVYWSRLIRVGGPIGLENLDRVVGGKCVLLPTPDARIGQPNDSALLDFAIECLHRFEELSGVHITTGQDLGHGLMSDGKTQSLNYMATRFRGSVVADTSQPTAEGNFYTVRGAVRALDKPLNQSRLGLIGCGNIGWHLLKRLQAEGAECLVVESNPVRIAAIKALGVKVYLPEEKGRFLREPMDALSVNANGGSLDTATIETICRNERLKFIGGCENLVMPDPRGAQILHEARKAYCPTELCGMMGYLTAVEEYLSTQGGGQLDMGTMLAASARLEVAGHDALRYVLDHNFAVNFEDAIRAVFTR